MGVCRGAVGKMMRSAGCGANDAWWDNIEGACFERVRVILFLGYPVGASQARAIRVERILCALDELSAHQVARVDSGPSW